MARSSLKPLAIASGICRQRTVPLWRRSTSGPGPEDFHKPLQTVSHPDSASCAAQQEGLIQRMCFRVCVQPPRAGLQKCGRSRLHMSAACRLRGARSGKHPVELGIRRKSLVHLASVEMRRLQAPKLQRRGRCSRRGIVALLLCGLGLGTLWAAAAFTDPVYSGRQKVMRTAIHPGFVLARGHKGLYL